eukprot:c9032_g1_i1.p2 GENE.c9032_g1_i1~~c9032_g1_i1.p2  ORF type:complete len:155 (-),score=40.95 c9032_g1_i1:324-788(-)
MILALSGAGRFLVDHDRDSDAPLQFLFNAMRSIGSAAVPLNMIILGCNLATNASWSAVPWTTNILIAIAKLLIMPIVGIISALILRSIFHNTMSAMFYLVVMVVTATPTANNIVVMAQVAGEDVSALATVIVTQYIFAPLTLTIALTIFISIVQ